MKYKKGRISQSRAYIQIIEKRGKMLKLHQEINNLKQRAVLELRK